MAFLLFRIRTASLVLSYKSFRVSWKISAHSQLLKREQRPTSSTSASLALSSLYFLRYLASSVGRYGINSALSQKRAMIRWQTAATRARAAS